MSKMTENKCVFSHLSSKYAVGRVLGEGSQGIVYEAICLQTGLRCALKRVNRTNNNSKEGGVSSATLREIGMFRSLSHPNVLGLIDSFPLNDTIFVVTEYMEADLHQVLRTIGGPLPVEICVRFLYHILCGLNYLHYHGIMHRDIKPQNIFIGADGVCRVGDLGLTKRMSFPMPDLNANVVTLWYRAPEVILGSDHYDGGIDMWALGTILAEMLLGEVLFQGDSEADQIQRIFKLIGGPYSFGFDVSRLPRWTEFKPLVISGLTAKSNLFVYFRHCPPLVLDLLSRLLDGNPKTRITAEEALKHTLFDYFRTDSVKDEWEKVRHKSETLGYSQKSKLSKMCKKRKRDGKEKKTDKSSRKLPKIAKHMTEKMTHKMTGDEDENNEKIIENAIGNENNETGNITQNTKTENDKIIVEDELVDKTYYLYDSHLVSHTNTTNEFASYTSSSTITSSSDLNVPLISINGHPNTNCPRNTSNANSSSSDPNTNTIAWTRWFHSAFMKYKQLSSLYSTEQTRTYASHGFSDVCICEEPDPINSPSSPYYTQLFPSRTQSPHHSHHSKKTERDMLYWNSLLVDSNLQRDQENQENQGITKDKQQNENQHTHTSQQKLKTTYENHCKNTEPLNTDTLNTEPLNIDSPPHYLELTELPFPVPPLQTTPDNQHLLSLQRGDEYMSLCHSHPHHSHPSHSLSHTQLLSSRTSFAPLQTQSNKTHRLRQTLYDRLKVEALPYQLSRSVMGKVLLTGRELEAIEKTGVAVNNHCKGDSGSVHVNSNLNNSNYSVNTKVSLANLNGDVDRVNIDQLLNNIDTRNSDNLTNSFKTGDHIKTPNHTSSHSSLTRDNHRSSLTRDKLDKSTSNGVSINETPNDNDNRTSNGNGVSINSGLPSSTPNQSLTNISNKSRYIKSRPLMNTLEFVFNIENDDVTKQQSVQILELALLTKHLHNQRKWVRYLAYSHSRHLLVTNNIPIHCKTEKDVYARNNLNMIIAARLEGARYLLQTTNMQLLLFHTAVKNIGQTVDIIKYMTVRRHRMLQRMKEDEVQKNTLIEEILKTMDSIRGMRVVADGCLDLTIDNPINDTSNPDLKGEKTEKTKTVRLMASDIDTDSNHYRFNRQLLQQSPPSETCRQGSEMYRQDGCDDDNDYKKILSTQNNTGVNNLNENINKIPKTSSSNSLSKNPSKNPSSNLRSPSECIQSFYDTPNTLTDEMLSSSIASRIPSNIDSFSTSNTDFTHFSLTNISHSDISHTNISSESSHTNVSSNPEEKEKSMGEKKESMSFNEKPVESLKNSSDPTHLWSSSMMNPVHSFSTATTFSHAQSLADMLASFKDLMQDKLKRAKENELFPRILDSDPDFTNGQDVVYSENYKYVKDKNKSSALRQLIQIQKLQRNPLVHMYEEPPPVPAKIRLNLDGSSSTPTEPPPNNPRINANLIFPPREAVKFNLTLSTNNLLNLLKNSLLKNSLLKNSACENKLLSHSNPPPISLLTKLWKETTTSSNSISNSTSNPNHISPQMSDSNLISLNHTPLNHTSLNPTSPNLTSPNLTSPNLTPSNLTPLNPTSSNIPSVNTPSNHTPPNYIPSPETYSTFIKTLSHIYDLQHNIQPSQTHLSPTQTHTINSEALLSPFSILLTDDSLPYDSLPHRPLSNNPSLSPSLSERGKCYSSPSLSIHLTPMLLTAPNTLFPVDFNSTLDSNKTLPLVDLPSPSLETLNHLLDHPLSDSIPSDSTSSHFNTAINNTPVNLSNTGTSTNSYVQPFSPPHPCYCSVDPSALVDMFNSNTPSYTHLDPPHPHSHILISHTHTNPTHGHIDLQSTQTTHSLSNNEQSTTIHSTSLYSQLYSQLFSLRHYSPNLFHLLCRQSTQFLSSATHIAGLVCRHVNLRDSELARLYDNGVDVRSISLRSISSSETDKQNTNKLVKKTRKGHISDADAINNMADNTTITTTTTSELQFRLSRNSRLSEDMDDIYEMNMYEDTQDTQDMEKMEKMGDMGDIQQNTEDIGSVGTGQYAIEPDIDQLRRPIESRSHTNSNTNTNPYVLSMEECLKHDHFPLLLQTVMAFPKPLTDATTSLKQRLLALIKQYNYKHYQKPKVNKNCLIEQKHQGKQPIRLGTNTEKQGISEDTKEAYVRHKIVAIPEHTLINIEMRELGRLAHGVVGGYSEELQRIETELFERDVNELNIIDILFPSLFDNTTND